MKKIFPIVMIATEEEGSILIAKTAIYNCSNIENFQGELHNELKRAYYTGISK